MKSTKTIKLLFQLLTVGSILALPSNPRIYGGTNAALGQFPFMASLNNPTQFCDGIIINKNWLITAAHCIDDITSNTTILTGTIDAQSGGTNYTIAKTLKHQDFNPKSLFNDIALIQVNTDIIFDNFTQAGEILEEVVENSTCYAVGWGAAEDVWFPEKLRFVELTAFGVDVCKNVIDVLLDPFYLGEEQICTLGPEGKGVCFGDSGGPLVCDGKVAGVVSYSVSACAKELPDVYTRTGFYVDWIRENVVDF